MPDKYSNFTELAQSERQNIDFRIVAFCRRNSPVAITAPHGGAIEPGTSELAQALAGDEYSLYCFEGTRREHNRVLHITSANFDEPKLLNLIRASRYVMTVHGLDESWVPKPHSDIYLGGLDRLWKKRVSELLRAYGFEVNDHPPARIAATEPNNVCNRGASGQGVQLEVSERLRAQMFDDWSSRNGRQQKTSVFDDFVAAIREACAFE